MQPRVSRFLLIIALAYVFLFFGLDKFVRPLLWIGWIPPSFDGFLGFTRSIWLQIFGVIEIVLGVLLLIPRVQIQRIAAAVMALHLGAVLTQTGLLTDTGVRDTGLFLAALSLGVWRGS